MTSLTPKLGSWALQKPGAFAKDDTLLPTSALVAAKRIAPLGRGLVVDRWTR